MAQEQVIVLKDDIDGSKGSETIRFGFEGKPYVIDLNKANANKFRKAIEPYITAGRADKDGRRSKKSGSASSKRVGPEPAKIREWAAANNIEVSPKGRIPGDIVKQYEQSLTN